VVHYCEHVAPDSTLAHAVTAVLWAFPGVPIFFTLSGYLIFKSADRSPSFGDYAQKRALRLVPGLWVCVFVSLAIVLAVGYDLHASAGDIAIWLAAQLTVFQSYNPEFLRGFGVGALNGSLWTIAVELQFYVIAPLMLAAFVRIQRRPYVLIAGIVALFAANYLYGSAKVAGNAGLGLKLLSVSVLPFLCYFALGGAIYVLKIDRWRYTSKHLAATLAIHAAASALIYVVGGRYGGNYLSPVVGITLASLVAAFIFHPELRIAAKLSGKDYSYSLYLYHMPVINAVLFLGLSQVASAVVVFSAVAALAVASWHFVEKPALRFARRHTSAAPVEATAAASLSGAP
jgi:peptidoglycan/LPS O-acetylase OafA/YrhL